MSSRTMTGQHKQFLYWSGKCVDAAVTTHRPINGQSDDSVSESVPFVTVTALELLLWVN